MGLDLSPPRAVRFPANHTVVPGKNPWTPRTTQDICVLSPRGDHREMLAAPDVTTSSRLIGLGDAAALLGVHKRTLRRYITAGRIQGYRIGPRLVKVDAADIDQLMRPIASVD